MVETEKNSSKIEKMLFEGIPERVMGKSIRQKKLPYLIRYFVRGESEEKASKDLHIYLPHVRSIYANLRRIEKEVRTN